MALLRHLLNDRFFDFDVDFPKIGNDLAIDLYEENNNLVAEMNIPGISSEDIDIAIEGHLLRVSGSREEKKEKKEKNYYSKEIKYGSFERFVRLPFEVQSDKTSAHYQDGVLKIVMPKKSVTKAEKIKVSVK